MKIEAVQSLEDEAMVAKLGVEFAKQMGFNEVILQGDSELVIKAINSYFVCTKWRIHHTIQEVVDVCCKLKS